MSDMLIESLTPERLCEVMQQAGYRVERLTDPQTAPFLRSATSGIPFDVRFATRLPGDATAYGDVTLMAVFQLQGVLPLAIINDWNNGRRFARLHLLQNLLMLDMDVNVFGGVTESHLRAQIEIWDRLLQELLPYLRDAVRALEPTNGAAPVTGAAVVAAVADEHP